MKIKKTICLLKVLFWINGGWGGAGGGEGGCHAELVEGHVKTVLKTKLKYLFLMGGWRNVHMTKSSLLNEYGPNEYDRNR